MIYKLLKKITSLITGGVSCKVCGKIHIPTPGEIFIIDFGKPMFGFRLLSDYREAYECPYCGHQIVLGEYHYPVAIKE